MSNRDIEPGERWGAKLNEELKLSNYGIICLTPENLHADWILFEAGALSKQVNSRLTPFLFQLKESEISQPLSQFQCLLADEIGAKQLVFAINKNLKKPLSVEKVEAAFSVWRNKLITDISVVPVEYVKPLAGLQSERELIEEVLQYTRGEIATRNKFKNIIATTQVQIDLMSQNEVVKFIKDCFETQQGLLSPLEVNPVYKKGYLAAKIAKDKYPSISAQMDTILTALAFWAN